MPAHNRAFFPVGERLSIKDRIWRRESAFARLIHGALRKGSRLRVPVIPVVHHLLLAELKFRKRVLCTIASKFYHEPLLRMMCKQAGPGLLLYEGMPKIMGNLEVTLGRNVTLSGEQVWIAGGSGHARRLEIGDDTYVGHAVQIVAGSSVSIGKHVLVANRVVMNGYDGHPLDPLARARNEPPGPDGEGPIRLEDFCWIGNDAMILKNVTIGRGAVVAAGSLVTRDVPPLTVVAGIPARTVREIPAPEGW